MSEKIMENWLNKTSAKQADVENSNIENSIEVAERAMSVSSSSNDELILETESDSSSADIISALPIRNKIVSRGKYAAAAWKVDPLLQDWLESANSENTKKSGPKVHT